MQRRFDSAWSDKMRTITLKCDYCGAQFTRPKGQYQEALKFNWRQFCSFKCRNDIKRKSVGMLCSNPECGKNITRSPREIKKNRTGKFYCSYTCSARINNRNRVSKYENHPCDYCGEIIPGFKKFCSQRCSSNSRKMTAEQLQASVVSRIVSFYSKHNRIPVKRELYGAYRTARLTFGSWNKAIKAAGFTPNPVMFTRHYESKDGHKCDSFAEKIIDDWLFENNIAHEVHVPYPDFPEFKSDFLIKGIFIEFFGLDGQHKKYSRLAKQKRGLAKKYNVKMIEIYPKDIYPKNNLDKLLDFLLNAKSV